MQDQYTPHHEFWIPILNILVHQGGTARVRDIYRSVEGHMSFNTRDVSYIHGSRPELRWKHEVRVAALRMRKKGLLEQSRRRNIWEISQKGCEFWYENLNSLETQQYLEPHDAEETSDAQADRPDDNKLSDTVELSPLVMRQIRARRGQVRFREVMLNIFGNRCAISGCNVIHVLEAAHIRPYRSELDNDPQNGLLLRADLHTLFDLDLLGIHPDDLRVWFHESVLTDDYLQFHRTHLHVKSIRPAREFLTLRWQAFLRRQGWPHSPPM